MLIDAAGALALQDDPTIRWQSTPSHTIGWKGNVLLPGHPAGAPTIAHLLARLAVTELDEIYPDLIGVFGLFVLDREDNSWTILGDHSGLYRIYYSQQAVSTSFLELARRAMAAGGAIEPKAVVEYLTIGGHFGRQTPVAGVTKLRRDEVLSIRPGHSPAITREAKRFAPHDGDDESYVGRHFDLLAQGLAGRRVSVDLTGGFDTRLIACLLARRQLPFEFALGGMRGSNELATASRVAAAFGRDLHFLEHDVSRLEEDLRAVFVCGDGLTDISRFHRDRQLCLSRLARGIEVMVHGGGGGFFQDTYMAHDFPLYGSRSVNLERYYRLRLTPVALPSRQLTTTALALQKTVEHEVIERMTRCRETTNNRTYERIGFDYRAPEAYGVTFSNYINMGLDVVAPLLDWRMVQVATRMSPWRRVFMMWHRRMITRECPAIAELPTADRFTASSRPRRVLAELGNYGRVQISRVGRKLGEHYLGRSLFLEVGQMADDVTPGYRPGLRKSALLQRAVTTLKERDILAQSLEIDAIREVHVGRILTMGTLWRHLEGERP